MAHPYDITAVETWPAEEIVWPTSMDDVHTLNAAIIPAVIASARQASDEVCRHSFMLAAPVLDVSLLTVCTAWLTWRRAVESGLEFTFSRPGLVASLMAGEPLNAGIFCEQVLNRVTRAIAPQPKSWLRGTAHGLLTNRRPLCPWEKPTAILNHNTMLQEMARKDRSQTFTYLMADRLFAAQRSTALPPLPDPVAASLTEMVAALLDRVLPTLEGLGGGDTRALRESFLQALPPFLGTVVRYDLSIQALWRDVPKRLWTGTGGNFLTRLARLAVKREGGHVTGFDHGGGSHIHANLMPFQVHELVFSDCFVVDSAAKARVLRQGISAENSLDGQVPAIEATTGAQASWGMRRGRGATPPRTVMYVTTAFVGETQYPLQPLLPDPIYADWQGRLIDGLAGQGYDVLVKQHPEGLRKGVPLKRSQAGTFLGGRFGEVMDQADAFVLDYPATSTLWEAICSEKPVVFIDHGMAHWNPEVWADFSARCAIVPSSRDALGRPVVDFAAVAAALEAAPDDGGAFAKKYLLADKR